MLTTGPTFSAAALSTTFRSRGLLREGRTPSFAPFFPYRRIAFLGFKKGIANRLDAYFRDFPTRFDRSNRNRIDNVGFP